MFSIVAAPHTKIGLTSISLNKASKTGKFNDHEHALIVEIMITWSCCKTYALWEISKNLNNERIFM